MSCAYSKLFVSVAVVQIPSCSRVLAVQYDTPMSHVRTLGIVRSMKSVEDQDVLLDELCIFQVAQTCVLSNITLSCISEASN